MTEVKSKAIEKILVPIDFSGCSRRALEYAVELAQKLDARVVAMHVVELPYYVVPDVLIHVSNDSKQTLTEFARNEALKDLIKTVDDMAAAGYKVSHSLTVGSPRERILQMAEDREYDLIVMGTHGRRGLSHLFLGSVAEQVVRRATCPVLTIRSPKQKKGKKKSEDERDAA